MAKKIGKVRIYGEIYPYGINSAGAFIERFDEACKGANEVDVYLHTQGGDVSEGTLMYNHIKGCGLPVNVYIVGVCCSMGTVIMMAAKRVYMCENSYLMVHAPQGGCFGTAGMMEKAAKGLRGMEKNFKKIYATKTGKNEKEIEELLVGDNWFTAQEAVDAKLIDGIVAPIATNVTQVSTEELKTQTPTALYNRFSACLTTEDTEEHRVFNSNNHKTEHEMDKEGLIRKFSLTGVTAQSSDVDVEKAIQEKLDAETRRADAAEQANKDAEKKRIEDTVAAAVNEKKITAEQTALYVGIGQASGLSTLVAVLGGMKTTPSLVLATRGGAAAQVGAYNGARASWSWEQWQKEAPRELEAMAKSEPEKFEALYKATFQ